MFLSQFAESHRLRGPVAAQGSFPTFNDALLRMQAALAYAEQMHTGQTRGDGSPFILHPLEVASLLYDVGASDDVIAAGLMHDLVEKTEVREPDLRERFGPKITGLVLSVTDDARISGYAKRKAALRRQVAGADDEAVIVFAADKLSKLRELGRELRSETGGTRVRARQLRDRRLKHYGRSLALLEERLPESPLVRDLRRELVALLRDRGDLPLATA
jgi:(p)ppGpp synthase/HD superfamily hydrolase